MAEFKSEKNQIPEADPTTMDNITSLVTTFEEKRDLVTRNVMSFLHDKKNDYIFIDIWCLVNNTPVKDLLIGFDKDKILTVCRNIIKFFEDK